MGEVRHWVGGRVVSAGDVRSASARGIGSRLDWRTEHMEETGREDRRGRISLDSPRKRRVTATAQSRRTAEKEVR